MEKNGKNLALFRIVLDVVMLLLMITMFNRRLISQTYHEIGGFALIALFLVHCVINRKMFLAFAAKKPVSVKRQKVMLVLDVLTIVAWIAVLVTSVLVSQKIFSFGIRRLHPWHKFFSAVAILITSVHFGMHWRYFWDKLRKAIPLPGVIAIVLLVAVLGFGCYSLFDSSYVRWLSSPFSSQQMHGGAPGGYSQQGAPSGDASAKQSPAQDASAKPETAQSAAAPTEGGAQHSPAGGGKRVMKPLTAGDRVKAIATGFSLIMLFAAATYGVDSLLRRKKKTVD